MPTNIEGFLGPKETPVLPRGFLLPETHENSNYILVRIPIEIHKLGHDERLTSMHSERFPAELGLTDPDIQRLFETGLARLRPEKP